MMKNLKRFKKIFKISNKKNHKKSIWNRKKKNLSKSKIKDMKENLLKLEKSLYYRKYHDHDDAKYIGIRDIGNLFNQSTYKDYY